MKTEIIFSVIFLFALVIFQVSFVGSLPFFFHYLNLFTLTLIFILEFRGLKAALWLSFGIGLLLDLFSFNFFGLFMASFLIAVFLVYLLLINFFTDYSLYSVFALNIFLIFLYEFFLNLFYYLANFFNTGGFFLFQPYFWFLLLIKIILNSLAVFILFYSINFLNKQLSPVFLNKNNKS